MLFLPLFHFFFVYNNSIGDMGIPELRCAGSCLCGLSAYRYVLFFFWNIFFNVAIVKRTGSFIASVSSYGVLLHLTTLCLFISINFICFLFYSE